jgi:hypothetical protein
MIKKKGREKRIGCRPYYFPIGISLRFKDDKENKRLLYPRANFHIEKTINYLII